MRTVRLAVLATFLLTLATSQARADIIDFGVNILPGGGVVQVDEGFWGDSSGYTLRNQCFVILCRQSSYEFGFDTSSLGDMEVSAAELSFDVSGQSWFEVFLLSGLDDVYRFIGFLGSDPISLSMSHFGDEIENGLLSIRVQTVTPWAESVRLDGANLRVDAVEPADLGVQAVPEPATLMLTGVGVLVTGLLRKRR